jgi:hypothetical protein
VREKRWWWTREGTATTRYDVLRIGTVPPCACLIGRWWSGVVASALDVGLAGFLTTTGGLHSDVEMRSTTLLSGPSTRWESAILLLNCSSLFVYRILARMFGRRCPLLTCQCSARLRAMIIQVENILHYQQI